MSIRIPIILIFLGAFFIVPCSVSGVTLDYYSVGKGIFYDQTGAGSVEYTDKGFHAILTDDTDNGKTLTKVTLSDPGGSIIADQTLGPDESFYYDVENLSDFTNYPNGQYTFNLYFDGESTASESRTIDLYGDIPSQIPMIINHAPGDTLSLTPTFQWEEWDILQPPGDSELADVYFMLWEDIGDDDWELVYNLSGLFYQTDYTIPEEVLEADSHYFFSLSFHYATNQGFPAEMAHDSHYVSTEFEFFTQSTPVPEPATILLFGSGLAGLAGFRKRSKRS